MKKPRRQTPPVPDSKVDQPPSHGPTKLIPLDIRPPTPMDLASLAAMIGPEECPYAALPLAMQLYVESCYFLHGCPTSPAELLSLFTSKGHMDRKLVRSADSFWSKIVSDCLELDPSSKSYDEARKYLDENGRPLKQTRSVIENVEKVLKLIIDESTLCGRPLGANFPQSVESFRSTHDGKVTYKIPRYFLHLVAQTWLEKSDSRASKWKAEKVRTNQAMKDKKALAREH